MPVTKKTFRGDRLRRTREQRGWTQQELMRRLHLGQNQIGRYESGEQEPSASIVALLARELAVNADYLLGLSDRSDPSLLETDLSPDEKQLIRLLRSRKFRTLLTLLIERAVTDEI